MSLLRVGGLSSGYGNVSVLFDVALEVGDGESVALLGANGAGKTTLLRTLSGVLPARAGTIELAGRRIERLRPHERVALGLAHVPEGRLVFPTLTVEENIRMGAHVVARDRARAAEGLERAYAVFPRLRERARQPAGTLSGGEQQMLAIARGLAGSPRLLAIDEASFGLAPQTAEQVFGIIRDIGASGTAVLLVEQNVPRSLEIAQRAYVLELGRIVFSGTAAEAREHPEFADFYLGGKPKTHRAARTKRAARPRKTQGRRKT